MKNLEKTISTKRPVFSGETVKSMFKNYTWKQVKTGLNSWFTLVELIIVITILAILATIAFVSFKGYTINARDWNRLATLNSIEKWLQLFQIKSWSYPDPDEKINIEASWTVISYQWVVWDNVSRNINMSKTPTDPLNNIKYVYATNANKNKYQLMALMEWTDYLSLVTQTYAEDLSTRNPKSIWNNVWIILETNNSLPTTTINTYSWTTSYKVLFKWTDSVTWSWNTLFSNIYNRRDDLMNNKTYASLDDSLVGYWDMETTTTSWALTVLKDLSKYWNNWTCYNSWTIVNCWTVWSWPQIVTWEWKTWKAMSFDGVDDYVQINKNINNTSTKEYTIIWIVKSYDLTSNARRVIFEKNAWYFLHINSSGSIWSDFHNWTWWIWWWILNNKLQLIINKQSFVWISRSVNTWKIKFISNWDIDTVESSTWNINNSVITSRIWAPAWMIDWVWKWIIDEVRIYNRALSDSEIRELYNATK